LVHYGLFAMLGGRLYVYLSPGDVCPLGRPSVGDALTGSYRGGGHRCRLRAENARRRA